MFFTNISNHPCPFINKCYAFANVYSFVMFVKIIYLQRCISCFELKTKRSLCTFFIFYCISTRVLIKNVNAYIITQCEIKKFYSLIITRLRRTKFFRPTRNRKIWRVLSPDPGATRPLKIKELNIKLSWQLSVREK